MFKSPSSGIRLCLAAAALLALVACDTAAERAERHYQNALELLDEGDTRRAIVELRTVFELEPTHRDARATMARTLLQQGDAQQAFSQYLRLVEQYPNDVEARLALAEMSILNNSWALAAEHGDAVEELAPDSARARVVVNALDYRQAVLDDNVTARQEAAERARALTEELPRSIINRSVAIDSLIQDGRDEEALGLISEVQEFAPQERRFYQMRLALHGRMENEEGIEQTLQDMVSAFPNDRSVSESLLNFYISRNDLEGAEEFLRSRVPPGEEDDGARVTLIRFLSEASGPDAALEQAEAFVREGTNDDLFASLAASLRYDMGQREEALAEFERIVQEAEASQQTNDIKVSYARILERSGNDVGSRALIEEVLAADPSHVEALVLRAEWMIESDLADEAIGLLRRAQDQEPENPRIFSTLAEAHLRNGERELAGEMLSLAVETSNNAAEESQTYARFLIASDRLPAAETVLTNALRLAPTNFELLALLGDVYARQEDWDRAERVERALRSLQGEGARMVADQLRVAILRGQQREDEAISFLEQLADEGDGFRQAEIAVITSHLQRGNVAEAQNYLQALLDEAPEDPSLRFLQAAIAAASGDLETAEEEYRSLIADGEGGERAWRELIRVLNQTGQMDEAEQALEEGLAARPESPELLWMRATLLEREGDFEGAIAIYEDLYDRNSSVSVIANNLASLLSTMRDDEESLERSARIARRLRGTEFPPYQDTYGWIQYRLGNLDEALTYLQPAARALADDPLVQHHLGMVYEALGREEDAISQFERAVELAGDDPRPAFDVARTKLQELQNRDTGAASGSSDLDALPSADQGGVTE
jgi:Flp pilus assembly protein TadD